MHQVACLTYDPLCFDEDLYGEDASTYQQTDGRHAYLHKSIYTHDVYMHIPPYLRTCTYEPEPRHPTNL